MRSFPEEIKELKHLPHSFMDSNFVGLLGCWGTVVGKASVEEVTHWGCMWLRA